MVVWQKWKRVKFIMFRFRLLIWTLSFQKSKMTSYFKLFYGSTLVYLAFTLKNSTEKNYSKQQLKKWMFYKSLCSYLNHTEFKQSLIHIQSILKHILLFIKWMVKNWDRTITTTLYYVGCKNLNICYISLLNSQHQK